MRGVQRGERDETYSRILVTSLNLLSYSFSDLANEEIGDVECESAGPTFRFDKSEFSVDHFERIGFEFESDVEFIKVSELNDCRCETNERPAVKLLKCLVFSCVKNGHR